MKHTVNTLANALEMMDRRLKVLESNNSDLVAANDAMRDLIEDHMVRNNPRIKAKRAMEGVDEFLRNRIGR